MHPTFRGSFSLKRVVPARVPGIGYDDLAIADGQSAALASPDRNERRRIFDALRAYCARDTLAMLEMRRAPMVIATAGVPRNRPTAVGRALGSLRRHASRRRERCLRAARAVAPELTRTAHRTLRGSRSARLRSAPPRRSRTEPATIVVTLEQPITR